MAGKSVSPDISAYDCGAGRNGNIPDVARPHSYHIGLRYVTEERQAVQSGERAWNANRDGVPVDGSRKIERQGLARACRERSVAECGGAGKVTGYLGAPADANCTIGIDGKAGRGPHGK